MRCPQLELAPTRSPQAWDGSVLDPTRAISLERAEASMNTSKAKGDSVLNRWVASDVIAAQTKRAGRRGATFFSTALGSASVPTTSSGEARVRYLVVMSNKKESVLRQKKD